MMLTMMMTDVPLPMPRSVICSPSHMVSMVAAVIVRTVRISKGSPGNSTRRSTPSAAGFSKSFARPKDWPTQSTSVR